MNGILISTTRTESGIPVSATVISDSPIAPPSMKVLGRRNPFKPKAAENTPKTSRIYSNTL
jgi:hypothetical protein